ncbi:DUF4279 domain-containing protein [Niallia sp. NCCP-28]|uniref:DUF4279 domain-containing protein n=1 Tax=Niallia sp. NCCP-28 TaxID=2934712 RepID=UPI0020881F4A|nr:DUF4279 domain-containing protein [Niallia sp. NCCP-28]GKU83086.1 hypothetical protein NCCP28_24820 [Niallia sp. NCCP-28]
MTKTTVMVCFSIFGDAFPIENISGKLGVLPTTAYKKGELIANRSSSFSRKETSWDLSTGYQVSCDVNEQLQQILNKLQNKTSVIKEIKENYLVECKFFIVIKIANGSTPALYLDKEAIKFASSIEAEFDIDLYASPYEDFFAE